MRGILLSLLAVSIAPLPACAGDEAAPLQLIGTIPLPHVEGRFDHFASDPAHGKLFVTALGNNSLEIFDLTTSRHVGAIPHLPKPTGVAFVPESNRIIVATGDDGACRFFDADTLKLTAQIDNLPDADNVRYDAKSQRVYVGYGDGALAVIDAKQAKPISSIKLAGHPESFQLAANTPQIFVNVPDARQVSVVDRDKGAVTAEWKLTDAEGNFPMALDEPDHRLFVGCRKPARLLVLDTETGRTVAGIPCVGDTDDLFYDAALHRVYISGGEGAISIIQQRDADHYESLESIKTAPGARTSFFAADLNKLAVAVPHRDRQPAELRIFAAPKRD
jgi:DNA-binding beta-propeller fold protein YncE